MEQQNIDELIFRKLSGRASEQDERVLEQWLRSAEENVLHFERLSNIWELAEHDESDVPIEGDKVWERLQDSVSQLEHKRRNKFSPLRYAAIFIVLLGSAALIYYLPGSPEKVIKPHINSLKHPAEQKKELVITKKEQVPVPASYHVVKTSEDVKGLFLPDSSFVFLEQNSNIRYQNFKQTGKRIAFLEGEGFFNVRHQEKGFEVNCAAVSVQVLGTIFCVKERKNKNRIEIYVEDGQIKVVDITNKNNFVVIGARECYFYDIDEHRFYKKKGQKFVRKFRKLGRNIKELFFR